VKSEGKGGVRTRKGGAARLAADVEALVTAADIEAVAAAAEAAGVVVVSRPNSPMKLKQPRFSRPPSAGAIRGGGHYGGNDGGGNSGGSNSSGVVGACGDGATAGAGATALSAWRSVARRARAVAALAAASG